MNKGTNHCERRQDFRVGQRKRRGKREREGLLGEEIGRILEILGEEKICDQKILCILLF